MRLDVTFMEENQCLDVGSFYEDFLAPTATVSKSGNVSTLVVTDVHGETTTQILDGTGGSVVSVSPTGTSANEVRYITVDGTEYKMAGGSSSTTYTHTQSSPAAVWTITHNLGRFPSVSVVDSAGNVVIGDVKYVSNNQISVTFQSAFSGKA